MCKSLITLSFLAAAFTVSAETVKVLQPGMLSTIVGEQKNTITNLQVSGKINGSDIAFLRAMAGADKKGNPTDGNLQILDLSEARIVAGGDAYYQLDMEAPQGMRHSAMEISQMMGIGWNVGNSLEVPVNSLNAETAWGNARIRQSLIDAVKEAGFNTVRIPVSWFVHATTGNTISPDWIERVKEVVDYCIADDLFVVVNCHYDNNWLQTKGFTDLSESNIATVEQRQYDIWKQIANAFKDYDEHLLFAGTNEPGMNSGVNINKERQAALNRYLQAFVNAVRETGGNNLWRTLIVQSWGAEISPALNYSTTMPSDPTPGRMMFEVHCYDPTLFGLFDNDQSWGKLYYYWGQGNHFAQSSRNTPATQEEQYIEDLMESLYQRFVKQGIPLVVGEYGANWRDLSSLTNESQDMHEQSLASYYYCMTNAMLKRGIVPVVWDNGSSKRPTFALFNRAHSVVSNSFSLGGIMKAKAENDVQQNVDGAGQNVVGECCTVDDVVGDYFFAGCRQLQQVILPNRTTAMGAQVFSGCDKLSNLTSLSGVVPVCSKNTFDEVPSTCTLTVPADMQDLYKAHAQWCAFKDVKTLSPQGGCTERYVSLEEGERLSDYLTDTRVYHLDGGNLTYEVDKYSIQELQVTGALNGSDYLLLSQMAGINADGSMTNGQLKVLDLAASTIVSGGDTYAIISSGEKMKTEDNVFPCYGLTRTNLVRVVLPEHITTIGRGALAFCSKLESIELKDGPTEIGDSAFASLPLTVKEVLIPNSVRVLGERCFMGSRFTHLFLGNGVSHVGAQAFRGCEQLQKISMDAVVPPTCAVDAFRYMDKSNVRLIVPQGTLAAYQAATVWQDFQIEEGQVSGIGFTTTVFDVPVYSLQGIRHIASFKGISIQGNKKIWNN